MTYTGSLLQHGFVECMKNCHYNEQL